MLSKGFITKTIGRCLSYQRSGVTKTTPLLQHCRPASNDNQEWRNVHSRFVPKKNSMKNDFFSWMRSKNDMKFGDQRETDILIIGGGLVGSAAAYFLKTVPMRSDHYRVTVIERDPTYTRSSSLLSVGGIRHQFSLPENVLMSMYTTEFLRNIKSHLSLMDEDPPDVQFNHHGYMFLATPDKVEKLENLVEMQKALGAQITLYNKHQLKQKFPWINLDGVEAASYGLYGEGWFDPWSLLKSFKMKNLSMDVQYIDAEVVGFTNNGLYGKEQKLTEVVLRNKEGQEFPMEFWACVNCAGAWAGEVAKLAGIGSEHDPVGQELPIQPRKRYVYVVHCPDGPGLDTPLTVDTTGAYFRREGLGGCYLMGSSPESEIAIKPSSKDDEPDIANLDVDYDFFGENIWPKLAHRVPAFEKLKVRSAWAGYYDYNYIDQNLIIGRHPFLSNFVFANGMSGHGIQQAVAIGNAVAELIYEGKYMSIDLKRLEFERFLRDEALKEDFIV